MDTKLVILFVSLNALACLVSSAIVGSGTSLPCVELPAPGKETLLDCVVESGQRLDYRDLGEITNARPTPEKFNVTITCRDGASVYLSWPFRAGNVASLGVRGCRVEGFLAERDRKQSHIDELRSVIFVDNVVLVTVTQLYDSIASITNMTKDFECGPTNVRENVFRNTRYEFPVSQNDVINVWLMEKLLSGESLQTLVSNKRRCSYPHLRRLEESGITSLSSVHFKLVEENSYPQLRSYSIRNNSLGRVPRELATIPLTFLPQLERLDMSHNNIDALNFTFSGIPHSGAMVYIDMRYNNVKNLTRAFVYQLATSRAAVIDVRHNPLTCSCSLYLYSIYLEQLARVDLDLTSLRDITCALTSGGTVIEGSVLDANFGSSLCDAL